MCSPVASAATVSYADRGTAVVGVPKNGTATATAEAASSEAVIRVGDFVEAYAPSREAFSS